MSKYFVCDTYAHSSEHSMFVESFVDYFNEKDDVVFLLNEVHSRFVSSNRKHISYISSDSSFKGHFSRLLNREIFKTFCFLFLIPYIIFTGRTIVLLGTSNIQTWLFSFFKYIPRLKVRFVLHGQLEYLTKGKDDNRRFGKLFLSGFNRICTASNFNVLVLGQHIVSKLNEFGYPRINSIPHPIPRSSLNKIAVENRALDVGQHNIAMVGLIRDNSKNCNKIYELILDSNVHTHVIGRVKDDFKIIKKNNFNFILWDRVYSESEFNEAVAHIDSFVYFFGSENYQLTASATALDAIIYGKAVFSLKNEAVSSLLQGYELFFEFDTVEEMSNAINAFDTETINNVDFNKQREKFLITEFKTEIEKWLC